MSEVHLFGVVPAADRPAITAERVRKIAHRDVAVLVGDIDGDKLTAARVLRTHWRVLEEAGMSTTVLPVRFGTVLADDRAVVEHFLEPAHDDLAAGLAEMAGKVQLTVKGTYDEQGLMASIVKDSPVVARLREQVAALPDAATYYKRIELGRLVSAEVERARECDARHIVERLEPLSVAARVEAPSTLDTAVHAAFLVERHRVDEFSEAVGALGDELAGRIALRYIGPLPPYSFTGDRAVAGAGGWA
jgi:hypothetical protein